MYIASYLESSVAKSPFWELRFPPFLILYMLWHILVNAFILLPASPLLSGTL